MALPTLTTTVNAFPTGREKTQMNEWVEGSVAIGSGGLYQTNGLPWTLTGNEVFTTKTPHWGEMYSASSGFVYRFDPTHQTIRIFVTGTAAGDPLNELANSASVTADTVLFRVAVQQN